MCFNSLLHRVCIMELGRMIGMMGGVEIKI